MKGLVATTAVLGVLAIGGLPALALTLASEETGPDTEPTTTLVEDADDTARSGPPPWAQGRGPDENRGSDDEAGEDEGDDEAPPAWAQGEDREPPPGWARNHAGAMPYGWTVRAWAYCLAEAEAGRETGEPVDPQASCGDKPAKPAKPAKAERAPGADAVPPGRTDKPEKGPKPGKSAKPKSG